VSSVQQIDQQTGHFVKATIKGGLALVFLTALVLLVTGLTNYAKGAALGGLASALNFYLMAQLLPRTLGRSRRGAEAMSLMSLVLRFALMGAALAICLKFPGQFAVAACIPALFAVQFVILADRFAGGRLLTLASGSR